MLCGVIAAGFTVWIWERDCRIRSKMLSRRIPSLQMLGVFRAEEVDEDALRTERRQRAKDWPLWYSDIFTQGEPTGWWILPFSHIPTLRAARFGATVWQKNDDEIQDFLSHSVGCTQHWCGDGEFFVDSIGLERKWKYDNDNCRCGMFLEYPKLFERDELFLGYLWRFYGGGGGNHKYWEACLRLLSIVWRRCGRWE